MTFIVVETKEKAMLIFSLAAAMTMAMLVATAFSLYREAEGATIKVRTRPRTRH